MLRKLTLLLSLLMTLGLTMSAAAQDPVVDEDDLEGIQSAYARTFMVDFDAMFEAATTPGAETELEFDQNAVMLVMTTVLTFDTEDNADAAVDDFKESSSSSDSITGLPMEVVDVDGLGDRAVMVSGASDEQGMIPSSSILLVKDSEMLFLIVVTGGDLDAGQQQVQDIAQFMLDREIQTDEVTLDKDGTSTGGAFDLMPTAEDTELVSGLAPSADEDMMSNDSSL